MFLIMARMSMVRRNFIGKYTFMSIWMKFGSDFEFVNFYV